MTMRVKSDGLFISNLLSNASSQNEDMEGLLFGMSHSSQSRVIDDIATHTEQHLDLQIRRFDVTGSAFTFYRFNGEVDHAKLCRLIANIHKATHMQWLGWFKIKAECPLVPSGREKIVHRSMTAFQHTCIAKLPRSESVAATTSSSSSSSSAAAAAAVLPPPPPPVSSASTAGPSAVGPPYSILSAASITPSPLLFLLVSSYHSPHGATCTYDYQLYALQTNSIPPTHGARSSTSPISHSLSSSSSSLSSSSFSTSPSSSSSPSLRLPSASALYPPLSTVPLHVSNLLSGSQSSNQYKSFTAVSNLLTRSQLLARFSGQQLHEHQNTNLQNTNSHTHSRHNHGCSDSCDRGSTDEHTRKQHALTSSKGTRKRKRWGNSHNSSDNDDDDDNKDDHSISNDGDDARKGTSKTDDGTNSGDSRDTSYRGAGDDDEKKDTSALQNVVRKLSPAAVTDLFSVYTSQHPSVKHSQHLLDVTFHTVQELCDSIHRTSKEVTEAHKEKMRLLGELEGLQ